MSLDLNSAHEEFVSMRNTFESEIILHQPEVLSRKARPKVVRAESVFYQNLFYCRNLFHAWNLSPTRICYELEIVRSPCEVIGNKKLSPA